MSVESDAGAPSPFSVVKKTRRSLQSLGAIPPLGADQELKKRFLNFNRTSGFIDPEGDGGAQIFCNRLRLREGPRAIDAEHLGGLSFGIHSSLLNNVAALCEDPVLEVFPAWPRDWEADFKLLAPGTFLVTSSWRDGRVEFVESNSIAGSSCKLKNPWDDMAVAGTQSEQLQGGVLSFSTSKGERIVVVRLGKSLEQLKRTI